MEDSAQNFLNKVIRNNGKPRIINIDKSGVNTKKIVSLKLLGRYMKFLTI